MYKFHIHQKFLIILILSFIAMVSLELASHMIEMRVIRLNKNFARIVNVSGKQRMFSQRITLFATRYLANPTFKNAQMLDQAQQEFQDQYNYLTLLIKEDRRYLTSHNAISLSRVRNKAGLATKLLLEHVSTILSPQFSDAEKKTRSPIDIVPQ